jgi:hypothetical protein
VRHYVPAQLLDGRPHLIVDGAPRPGTVCTLSHWPGTPTPDALRADLSAEIALRALARPDLVPDVDAVSIDHYDEDGVASLALMVVEGLADAHAGALVEAARVGDFGVVTDRRHALVAFALAALADPERTPVPGLRPGRRPDDWLEVCSAAATEALAQLPALVEAPEDHEVLWHDEAAAYDAAHDAIASGRVTIDEHADADLAVVRLAGAPDDPAVLAAGWAGRPVHPAAVHSVTACTRVATLWGRRYEVRYRYETWVRLESHRPRLRVDLTQLAAQLSALEGGPAAWVFDGASAITPALHRVGDDSSLEPERFVEAVCGALADLDAGPPAWDPYGIPTRA